jgi:hypothetical protein
MELTYKNKQPSQTATQRAFRIFITISGDSCSYILFGITMSCVHGRLMCLTPALFQMNHSPHDVAANTEASNGIWTFVFCL